MNTQRCETFILEEEKECFRLNMDSMSTRGHLIIILLIHMINKEYSIAIHNFLKCCHNVNKAAARPNTSDVWRVKKKKKINVGSSFNSESNFCGQNNFENSSLSQGSAQTGR